MSAVKMNYILRQSLPASSHDIPIEIHLTEDEVPVGRRSKTVLSKFPQISREHAIFYKVDDGSLFVKDLKSLNGIYVNDVRIGSSLKSLSIGDVIGFGVTTNQNDEGFVCVVCCDNPNYKVKPEVIVISDSDDDDVPQNCSKPALSTVTCRIPVAVDGNKNFLNSNITVSKDFTPPISVKREEVANCSNTVDNSVSTNVLSSRTMSRSCSGKPEENCPQLISNSGVASSSQPKFTTIPLSKATSFKGCLEKTVTVPSTTDSQNKNSMLKVNNSPKNSELLTMSHITSSASVEGISNTHLANILNTATTTKFESLVPHNIKDFMASVQNFIKKTENIAESCKDSVPQKVPSETFKTKTATNIQQTSNSSNSGCSVPANAIVKLENPPIKHFSVKKCSIPLIRCDSKFFQWPSDLKNPFKENNLPSVSEMSDLEIINVLDETSNRNFNGNAQTIRSNKLDNIESKENNKRLEESVPQKRKYSSISNAESSLYQPTTAKKHCLTNENEYDKGGFSHDTKKYQSKPSKELESDSEGEVNYSQVEEVIYISDDDDYLDFKSSENYIHIKKEPIDNIEEDNCLRNLDINNEFQELPSDNEMDNFINVNQKDDNNKETIESIKAFVGITEQEVPAPSSKSITAEENNYLFKKVVSDLENNSDVDDYPESKTSHVFSKGNVEKPTKPNAMLETKSKAIKSNFHLNKNAKINEESKIKFTDAKPLEYRSRKMRGRDERVVERAKSKTPESAKKKKFESPRKELSKLSDNSKLKNFKIPLKHKENNHTSSKSTDYDRPSSAAVSTKNKQNSSKKSPTVKTRPYESTSRMGFLVQDVKINPQNSSKPTAVVAGYQKSDGTSSKRNVSVKERTVSTSVPNNRIAHSIQKIPDTINKNVNMPQNSSSNFNPRDPRQNRQVSNSSNETYRQDSGIRRTSLPNEENAWSKRVPPNYAYQQGRTVSSERKTTERSVPSTMQNNIRIQESSVSCLNQNNQRRSFERPIQTVKENNTNSADLRLRLIKNLLCLNTKWLQEQSRMKFPPPDVSKGVTNLRHKYDSFDRYVSLFYPMLMLELWEQMYIVSKDIFGSNKQYNKFFFSILSYTSKTDLIELKCESIVNEKVCFPPNEGYLTILELKENPKKCCPMFGYIFKHKTESLHLNNLKVSLWKDVSKEWITNAKHWTFYVYIKKKEMSFALDSIMKGNGLCNIRNKLRLVDALSYLKHSPLMNNILHPQWKTFFVKYSAMAPTREFNAGQMEVIECVTSEIIKSKREPKIILLQGPPGTGKTHTIIGLIHKFLAVNNFDPNYKILVTAPSNAAIDEIGCRLIGLNEKLNGKLKFIRVGVLEQIHTKMKPYTLDRKANCSNSKEKELQYLASEISKLKKDVYNREGNERLRNLESRYKHLSNENFVNQRDSYTDVTEKQTLLKDSHIILSTLSGCGLSLLLKTFKPHSSVQFSFCIVDESTQCTELEILQPLMVGIKKMILVGDHKQLPATVLSKEACKHGFEKSMFERFHEYFEKFAKRTPMFTLTEQFRMHSGICQFPSKFIYDQKLITNPNTDVEYANFPLKPYMMLDIYVSQEKDDFSSKVNCTEAQVIINICTVLLDCVADSVSSIGIITPYQAQRSLYLKALNVNPRYKDIEVNTVDSFQGREKDIIIISTVRANSQSGGIGFLACKRRLNVAITRARKCLIICVHGDSLISYHGWRELICDAKERNVCFPVTSPKDIPYVFKHYMQKNRSGVSSYM